MSIDKTLAKLHIELSEMQQEVYKQVQTTKGDIVILSPTGSGKTLAYLLPLTELIDKDDDRPQALVILPGRELALQSDDVLHSMGTGLRSTACYGGRTAMDEHKTLKKVCPQVIFGTPGRLNDHIAKGNFDIYGIKYVVIDEFDKCLAMGFHNEMERLLKNLPGVRRRFLLSATDAEDIPHFVRLEHTVKIDYTYGEEQVPEQVEMYAVNSPDKDKLDTLSRLLRSFGDASSIVFLNYRDSVERTASWLRNHGFAVSAFHGGMEQKEREDTLYKFSNGSANVLVSTDLASRGLDIPDIGNIIHYHLPLGEEEYIHRIGRTARWKAQGRTFFIIGPEEQKPTFINEELTPYAIPDSLPQPAQPRMATIYIGKGKKDKISKGDIVGFLCKKGGLAPTDIGRIDVKDRYAYAAIATSKLRQALTQTQGEKIKGLKTIVEIVR